MFRYLPLVFKNSLRNPVRTLLTIASLAGSLCLLGVMFAMYNALYLSHDDTPEGALRLVTRNKVSLTFTMPGSYEQKIARIPGVKDLMNSQWFGGVYKEPKNFFARFAVEPDKLFIIHPEYVLPDEQKKAFMSERTACVIGKKIATDYNLHLGDRITLKGDIFPVNMELTVRGIYEDTFNDETLYFHIKYLFEALPERRRDFAGMFVIMANSPEDVPRISQAVDDMFRNSTSQTKTESERAFQLGFVSQLGDIKLFLISICAAVTFTILLVAANTMAMSVRERIKEVGILKTLGFTNGQVLFFILGEAAVISTLGGIIGTLIAYGACQGIHHMPAFIAQLKTLTITPPVFVACVSTALVIGVVSAFFPAYSASRTPILDSLRYTG
jgi:putative ABC transport system permease protein